MTVSRRDRWLGRYAYATLDTSVGAIVANSRDRAARLLGLATLSKGGGVSDPPYPAPAGFRWVFVTENSDPGYENDNRAISLVRAA